MATHSTTVKITPNNGGNKMTSTKHGRFSDREIAQAAPQMSSTESTTLAQPAFERHYRIGELATMWQLGRETVRLLVKDERGVIRIRLGHKKAHTIYSVPQSVAARIHTRLLNSR
jgi:hypothetical protein